MRFDQQIYIDEMKSLLKVSKSKLTAEYPNIEIYTISIWTDPNAAVSAINFDTYENSIAKVSAQNQWAQAQYDRLVAEGDLEQARLFMPSQGRHCNPAGFSLSEFQMVQHSSFEPNWEEQSQGKCWDLLEPALKKVGEIARQAFRDLPLHSEAELAVNSRSDWYACTWPVG